MSTIPATELAPQWIAAKAAEDAAKLKRLDIEAQICASLALPPGASQTISVIPGFRVKYDINRTFDTDALRAAWDTLPEVAQSCVRWKAEVAAREFHAACDMAPTAIVALSQFITTKDAKPSFTYTPKL
jgi:hypothetical protein